MFLDWKLLQEWSFPRSLIFILGPTLLLLFINDLLDVVICNIAIYVDDTTLWQQMLEFGSELESSHLSDTKGWGRIGLLMSMLEKVKLPPLTGLITLGLLIWKSMSVFEEKAFLKLLGLLFSSILNWYSYIVSVAKNASKKIEALIYPTKILSSEVAIDL